MSSSIYSELSWLAPAPPDLAVLCRDLLHSSGELGLRVRTLANCRLDENQLFRLARTIHRIKESGGSLHPLQDFCLGVISNSTADFLTPAIVASAARHGLAVNVARGDYGQVMQDALSKESAVNSARPDAVLIAIDYRWYPFQTCPGDPDKAELVINGCIAQLAAICAGIRSACGAICIVQTLAAPPENLFGSLDRALPGTLLQLIDGFNTRLANMVQASNDVLLDIAGLAQVVGVAEWHDPASWNMAKLPFSHRFLPLYAEHVARLLGSMRGKSRRCLILDLDNTVWGGVVGDDGLEGIQIAQGDATGEAFLDVQRLALSLRARGVVLAVCSKNTDEIARKPFSDHAEMLLKLHHIAVFQANWNDKATNIKAIAEELSLGLESLAFLDDNPAERGLIRRMLPEVAVPELPADPAFYARTLVAAGYFDTIRFSKEDAKRADFYQDNSRRAILMQQAGDIDSYLASLNMQITFQPFDETGRARITQLINKSNQFNLTTRRYSEVEVAAIQNDPNCFALQVRLSDAFGDNGMISVIICRRISPLTIEFDTWLMSCRVLGRRVENVVLKEISDYAIGVGVKELLGKYVPTDRNALVQDHYEKLGFEKMETLRDGTTTWRLILSKTATDAAPMTVHRTGYTLS